MATYCYQDLGFAPYQEVTLPNGGFQVPWNHSPLHYQNAGTHADPTNRLAHLTKCTYAGTEQGEALYDLEFLLPYNSVAEILTTFFRVDGTWQTSLTPEGVLLKVRCMSSCNQQPHREWPDVCTLDVRKDYQEPASEDWKSHLEHWCVGEIYDVQVAVWEKGDLTPIEEAVATLPSDTNNFLSYFLEELEEYEAEGAQPWQGVVEEITAPDGTQWVVYINEHED